MAEKNLKSREVINATGINQSLFSKILNGDRKPSEDVKQRLSEYFNEDFHKYKY
jgi:transcriptional regulator with XRE-family HTH domain